MTTISMTWDLVALLVLLSLTLLCVTGTIGALVKDSDAWFGMGAILLGALTIIVAIVQAIEAGVS